MAQRVRSQYRQLPVPEACDIIHRECPDARKEEVQFQQSLGRVLAADVCAASELPPFPASIKDGYAVLASDGLGTFPIVGDIRAGGPEVKISPGQVAYITTGAPVPEGADAVIQIEDTERVPSEETVTILKAAKVGQDIRTVGSDVALGQLCLPAGTLIGPPEVGILATINATKVSTFRKPLVAVMSTGDEIVDPGSALGHGQVWDSNRSTLLAAAREAGADVLDLGIVKDQAADLEAVLQRALKAVADVIITSGGVSMGDKDLVKPLLERSGKVHFGRVLMKPGKPLTFATLEAQPDHRVLFFGLPGNPVSSTVCFHLFVKASLYKLAGRPKAESTRVHAVLGFPIKLDKERPEYHRVTLTWQGPKNGGNSGHFLASSTGGQRSSRLLSMRSACGLLELPQGTAEKDAMETGEVVSCILIGDLRDMLQFQ